jgi:hypothetical protein
MWTIVTHPSHTCSTGQTTINKVMKSKIFCNVIPCSLLYVCWRFGGTRCFHLQGRRLNHASNTQSDWFSLQPWRMRHFVPPKCQLTSSRLHGVTSEIRLFFVATSNLTKWQWIYNRVQGGEGTEAMTPSALRSCAKYGGWVYVFVSWRQSFQDCLLMKCDAV